MLLTGDIRLNGVTDPKEPFELINDLLHSHDVVFSNLEGALCDELNPYNYYTKTGWTPAGTAGAGALVAGNVSAVGLANNVTMPSEVEPTITLLDQLGIGHAGAGMNLQAARAPAIVQRGGVKYGFLQRTSIFHPFHHKAVPDGPMQLRRTRYMAGMFTPGSVLHFRGAPGVATIRPRTAYEPSPNMVIEGGGNAIVHTWPDPDELADFVDDIQSLRPLVDVLVSSHHWRVSGSTGNLWFRVPGHVDVARDYREEIAHAAIDAGADIVFGHGSHNLDGIEVYKGKAIFYGLGELYFPHHRIDQWLLDGASVEDVSTLTPRGLVGELGATSLVARIDMDGPSISRVYAAFVDPNSPDHAGRPIIVAAGDRPKMQEHLATVSRSPLKITDDEIVVIEKPSADRPDEPALAGAGSSAEAR